MHLFKTKGFFVSSSNKLVSLSSQVQSFLAILAKTLKIAIVLKMKPFLFHPPNGICFSPEGSQLTIYETLKMIHEGVVSRVLRKISKSKFHKIFHGI